MISRFRDEASGALVNSARLPLRQPRINPAGDGRKDLRGTFVLESANVAYIRCSELLGELLQNHTPIDPSRSSGGRCATAAGRPSPAHANRSADELTKAGLLFPQAFEFIFFFRDLLLERAYEGACLLLHALERRGNSAETASSWHLMDSLFGHQTKMYSIPITESYRLPQDSAG